MGCLVSRTYKTWSRSLLFEDFHENGAEANTTYAGANTVCRQYTTGLLDLPRRLQQDISEDVADLVSFKLQQLSYLRCIVD